MFLSKLKILQGVSFLIFAATAITYLIQDDYSNWSIFMCLAFMVLASDPDGMGGGQW